MPIYVIGGEKGGTGKSTLATNLAVALQLAGHDPLLVDADRQRTSTLWADKRQSNDSLKPITTVQRTGKLYQALVDLATRYEFVLVDAGGHDSIELRTALVAADHLYSPVQASQSDLWTLDDMSALVEQARDLNPGLEAHLVLSRAPTHPTVTETADALALLSQYPLFRTSPSIIRDRKMFRDAMFRGAGVLELGDAKAAAELRALAGELTAATTRGEGSHAVRASEQPKAS